MGLLAHLVGPLDRLLTSRSSLFALFAASVFLFVLLIVFHVLKQLLWRNPNEPPVVFHWFPFLGNTVLYGIDPYKFFFQCRAKVWIPPPIGMLRLQH